MGKKIRFILTCACILLPLLFLCLYARFNLIAFADGEAPAYIWNKEATNKTQEKRYDVIILGDSLANASYLPAALSDSCLNLSLGGTTPMETYYVINDWLKYNPAPKVCYLSFMDFHLQRVDCFWTRSIYTHRYALNEEIAMLSLAVKFEESSILQEDYLTQFIEYGLNLPNRYMTAILNAGFNRRKENNLLLMDGVDLRGGAYVANQDEYDASADILYDSFSVAPLFDAYYRKIIELCLKNDIQVRIVKMPLPDNAVFSGQYNSEVYAYYSALQEAYPGISVDWLKQYPKNNFRDAAHMNYRGALRFSTEIKEMYPVDFGEDVYSDERVKAINYYLVRTTRMDDLLMWISDREYTAVVCDRTGKFETYSQGLVQDESAFYSFKSKAVTLAGPNDFTGCVFVVSGKEGLPELPVSFNDGALELKFNGGGYAACGAGRSFKRHRL